jgi:ribonuclease BN (tRNA processing enzyme)
VSLTLTVLGTSGSYPGQGRACSGYLIRGGDATVWLDAGSGAMANLQEHIDLTELDAVVLSHEHPDHCSDLNGLEVACAFGPGPDQIPVYAPDPVKERLYRFSKSAIDWNRIADRSEITIGRQSWSFARTDHPPETLAARVEVDGVALGYTSDTGPGWSAAALGRLDTLLAEATFQDVDAEAAAAEAAASGVPASGVAASGVGHLSARQAGQMAKECGVSRLILTHIWPTQDREVSRSQAEEAFGSGVEVAEEHDLYVIGEENS